MHDNHRTIVMNDFVDELYVIARYEAGADKLFQATTQDVYQKFTQLLVQECIESLWTEECDTSDLALEEYTRNRKRIEQRFGVKYE